MTTVDLETHFLASHGFFELGMLEEAHAELDALRDVPESAVLVDRCRLALLVHEQRWHDAGTCATNLCELEPDVPDHYLAIAAIQRELGMARYAIDTLLESPLSLVGLPDYHYDLARYFALTGEVPTALRSLRRAIELDDSCHERARSEPDLSGVLNLLPTDPRQPTPDPTTQLLNLSN